MVYLYISKGCNDSSAGNMCAFSPSGRHQTKAPDLLHSFYLAANSIAIHLGVFALWLDFNVQSISFIFNVKMPK